MFRLVFFFPFFFFESVNLPIIQSFLGSTISTVPTPVIYLKQSHDQRTPVNHTSNQKNITISQLKDLMTENQGHSVDPELTPSKYSDDPKTDPLRSPLHRLQAEIAKDKKYSIEPSPRGGAHRAKHVHAADNESIYSFDSVSTSGRLLDRLDLDPDEYDDAWLRRRESTFLVQSTGRLLDRLGLEDNMPENMPPVFQHTNSLSSTLTEADTRHVPIRGNSSLGMERLRSASKVPVRTVSGSSKFPVKSAPGGVVRPPTNNLSFDSLHGDIALATPTSVISLASLDGGMNSESSRNTSTYDGYRNARQESSSNFISLTVAPSPVPRPRLADPALNLLQKRTASGQSVSSTNSVTSFECSQIVFNPTSFFDPLIETSLKKAISLRMEGNHREASYQLQLLANAPVNYPKAMYLYSQALHQGQGVKLNQLQSVRWLCRCVLVCHSLESSQPKDLSELTTFISNLSAIEPDKLIAIITRNISGERNDPFLLFDHFKALSQTVLNRIQTLNTKENNILGCAYFSLGNRFLLGQGLGKDEEAARLFFAKSASLGFSDAMVTLGELWCGKTKSFKKDLNLAAAWLRLGELFNKQDIGNSWIYKDKYMEKKKPDDDKKSKDRKRL